MPASKRHSERTDETVVNALLAETLRDHGLTARAERRKGNQKPDVRITIGATGQVILECKWDGSRNDLENQLAERVVEIPDALARIGVLYPESLRHGDNTLEALQAASDLQWWLHSSLDKLTSNPVTRRGSVNDLADQLRTLPLQLEGVDRVVAAANAVGYALDQSAKQLDGHARISRRIADIIAITDKEKDRAAALRIGCLVLFNALAFQDRLAAVNEAVPTVSETIGGGIDTTRSVWRTICAEIDYVPVFELAADILDVVADGPAQLQQAAIAPLAEAMVATRRLEGHDLSGRLFHTLLTDAKFTGAYYTSVPAATLLTRLVFHEWPRRVDWKDHEFPASLNVADLACGTGTLLMAVASEVERRHLDAGGTNATALHKAMVEQALHGYDVQLSAIHFAATSLAMLNPDIQFDRLNLYVLPLGAEGEEISLGSLDFLGTDEVAVQYALSSDEMGVATQDAQRVSGAGMRGAEEGATAKLPSLDLAIMNPPFTRSVGGNLLFGSLPKAERRTLQNELSRRLKSRSATATAGLGAAFVAAAAPKLRAGEGRLALVLPATVCTGPSWAQTRALIERDFTLEMVISSHDPLRWHFSDSTDLSEALLIATRRPAAGGDAKHRTTFVNLWQNPDSVLDAHEMARAVAATTPARLEETGASLAEIAGRHVGEMVSLPAPAFEGKQWLGVQFARADLIRSAERLLSNGEVWVPGETEIGDIAICPLCELGEVGPDRRDMWDGFERTDSVTAYPLVENHDTNMRRFLAASPEAYLSPLVEPRPGRRLKPLSLLWPKAGRLLISERLWLETTRVAAMRAPMPVLSNVWWPVRIDDVDVEKALAIWLNSSFGLLSLLAHRTSTRGGWVALKKAELEDLPVLDPRQLSAAQLAALADLFDDLADHEFDRLSRMAECPVRAALDTGIADILNLPNPATLRTLLASEPVISNRRL